MIIIKRYKFEGALEVFHIFLREYIDKVFGPYCEYYVIAGSIYAALFIDKI